MTKSVEIDVSNPSGLHARPAAAFVRVAAGFSADVRVTNVTTGSPEVSAKSITGVLSLGALQGHRIRLRVEGEGEATALEALGALVAAGLGESTG